MSLESGAGLHSSCLPAWTPWQSSQHWHMTGSHVEQTGLKLVIHPRMTLNSWSPSSQGLGLQVCITIPRHLFSSGPCQICSPSGLETWLGHWGKEERVRHIQKSWSRVGCVHSDRRVPTTAPPLKLNFLILYSMLATLGRRSLVSQSQAGTSGRRRKLHFWSLYILIASSHLDPWGKLCHHSEPDPYKGDFANFQWGWGLDVLAHVISTHSLRTHMQVKDLYTYNKNLFFLNVKDRVGAYFLPRNTTASTKNCFAPQNWD